MDNNTTYDEIVAEFNTGKTLKYRIVEVKRHIREQYIEGTDHYLTWIDKIQYIGQRLVHKSIFHRKWETIEFKDEFDSITYFDNYEDILHWFKYLDGEQCKPIKYYSTKAQ